MIKNFFKNIAKRFLGYGHRHTYENGQKRFWFSWGEASWNKDYNLYFLESVPIEGYYDEEENRHHFSFHIGKLYVVFGLWKLTCKADGEYDTEPKWTGIWFSPFDEHDQYVAFHWKGKTFYWYMPWQLNFIKRGEVTDPINAIYHDKCNDVKVKVKLHREEMVYRRRIFRKLNWNFLNIKLYRVDYDFLGEEVGSRVGTWKGGTLSGSGCLLHKDEPLVDALYRINP